MVQYEINNIGLQFWLVIEDDGAVATCWVKRVHVQGKPPPDPDKKFPVFSINSEGECWRHTGLPKDWGFIVTKDGKIKEVR